MSKMNIEDHEVITVTDDALREWREFRGPGYDKPGAVLGSRDHWRLLHADNVGNGDRGTCVPLAEEDEPIEHGRRTDE